MWRILIVDGHALVRRALAKLIDSDCEMHVCGEASTHAAGLEAIDSLRPDLVITDLSFDALQGLSLVGQIGQRHPGLPMLVVSLHDEARYAARALRAGARGYVEKHMMGETLLGEIRHALGITRR
jgi:DNA-binding NarL/FixJ family response regulator